MTRLKDIKINIKTIWFGFLCLYIMTSYLAQDVLLPSKLNSLVLYAFLAYSIFAILLSGKVKLSAIVLWEMLFLALSFVAMLYSPSIAILGGTYYALLVNFILVFVLAQMPWNTERFHLIMKTFVMAAALLIVLLALTGNLKDDSGRLGTELTGNANTLAMMLMVSAIYGIWLILSSNNLFKQCWYLFLVAIIYLGMLLSGGRKYIVVPIIFAYILWLYKTDNRGRRHIAGKTAIILMLAAILYLIIMKIPFFYDIIGHRFEGVFAMVDDSYQMDNSTFLRKQMTAAAFSKWLESPLWGYGFDSFKYYNVTSVTGEMYYSHNNFAELLYNQGLIGFLAYYGFYAYLLYAQRQQKNSLYKGFTIGAIVSLLFFEYYGITYSTTPTQILLCICAMLRLGDGQEKKLNGTTLENNKSQS